jgi:hypothetical protein
MARLIVVKPRVHTIPVLNFAHRIVFKKLIKNFDGIGETVRVES